MKHIFLFFIFAVSLLVMPISVQAQNEVAKENVEESFNEVNFVVKDKTIHITNADGKRLEVYNLAGMRITTVKIEGDDVTFTLNITKGYYILKIEKTARKVTIS